MHHRELYSSLLHIKLLTALLVALLLICCVTPVIADHQLQEERAEVGRVLAKIGTGTPAEIMSRLRKLQAAPIGGKEMQAATLQLLPQAVRNNRIVDGDEYERVKSCLAPVIAYHHRSGLIDLLLYKHQYPFIGLANRSLLLVSTRTLTILSAIELRALAAHELAHEYNIDDYYLARNQQSNVALREVELFCDAVAVVTMADMGEDTASYMRGLEIMAAEQALWHLPENGSPEYPSMAARKLLNAALVHLFSHTKTQTSNQLLKISNFLFLLHPQRSWELS